MRFVYTRVFFTVTGFCSFRMCLVRTPARVAHGPLLVRLSERLNNDRLSLKHENNYQCLIKIVLGPYFHLSI